MSEFMFQSGGNISQPFKFGKTVMAQCLRVLAAHAEDSSLGSGTHIRQFRAACKSSPRRSNALIWPNWVPHLNTHTPIQMHIHTHTFKNYLKKTYHT